MNCYCILGTYNSDKGSCSNAAELSSSNLMDISSEPIDNINIF